MTHDPPYERRVTTTRRVEYRLRYDPHRRVRYDDLALAVDAADVERPPDSTLRLADTDDHLVLYWEEVTLGTARDLVNTRARELADALGLPNGPLVPRWPELLRLVRRLVQSVPSTVHGPWNTSSTTSDDPPVVALLPRDWPRRLDALLADAGNQLGLLTLLKRLLDDWVLAAVDADARHGTVDRA